MSLVSYQVGLGLVGLGETSDGMAGVCSMLSHSVQESSLGFFTCGGYKGPRGLRRGQAQRHMHFLSLCLNHVFGFVLLAKASPTAKSRISVCVCVCVCACRRELLRSGIQ